MRADDNFDDKYSFTDLYYYCVCTLGDAWQMRSLTLERGASSLLSSPKKSIVLVPKKLSVNNLDAPSA